MGGGDGWGGGGGLGRKMETTVFEQQLKKREKLKKEGLVLNKPKLIPLVSVKFPLRDWVGTVAGGEQVAPGRMCLLLGLCASAHHGGTVESMGIGWWSHHSVGRLSRGCTHILVAATAPSIK